MISNDMGMQAILQQLVALDGQVDGEALGAIYERALALHEAAIANEARATDAVQQLTNSEDQRMMLLSRLRDLQSRAAVRLVAEIEDHLRDTVALPAGAAQRLAGWLTGRLLSEPGPGDLVILQEALLAIDQTLVLDHGAGAEIEVADSAACPRCGEDDNVYIMGDDETEAGFATVYECNECGTVYQHVVAVSRIEESV